MHIAGWQWTKSSVLAAGLIAIAVATAFFGQRTYKAIERDLSAAAESGRMSISTLAAATLSLDFQRLIDVARSLASRVRFTELVARGEWNEASKIMTSVPSDFAGVEQILIVDTRGYLRGATPESGFALGRQLGDREWFRQTVKTAAPYLSNVEFRDEDVNLPTFFVSVPVKKNTGELIAVIALRISTNRFLELFSQLPLESDGTMHVIDRLGASAFDSGDPNRLQLSNWSDDPNVRRVLRGESGSSVGVISPRQGVRSRETYFSTFASMPLGWGVVAQWPTKTVFAARDDELARVTIASAFIVAMTIATVILLLRLIIERRQTEAERLTNALLETRVQARTAQLENMNRELESFSYSISHDLRAPLRAIDGYSALLSEEHQGKLSAEAQRYIDNVHRNVVQMSRLIDELLELSRVGRMALQYQTIDMTALVNEVLPTILMQHRTAHVTFTKLPPTQGDITLLRQIWVNLIDNAAKYSSHENQPQIDITGSVNETESVYCVADNGVGFDMQHYDRLFKPFSRLHSPGEFAGTGVGLAIVKRIVERHDGAIWAESVSHRGTKVFFSLPHREVG